MASKPLENTLYWNAWKTTSISTPREVPLSETTGNTVIESAESASIELVERIYADSRRVLILYLISGLSMMVFRVPPRYSIDVTMSSNFCYINHLDGCTVLRMWTSMGSAVTVF